ncbi:MAG: hypothetical protein ACKE5M_02885 [Methylophilaceae bacterium]
MKKTSISSVVCLDIIDFSKKKKTEQNAIKKQFNALISLAVVDIPEKDRTIVDTGHGAIITCHGPLENALEDALFIALTIRDEVINGNASNKNAMYLLMGINLGSVSVDESSNVVGDGLVEAKRIMSFAKPNQILVSGAYYELASKLTLEIAQMFEKYDMHAYEHDIYAVRLLNEKAAVDATAVPSNAENIEPQAAAVGSTYDWRTYALPFLLGLIMLFVLIKWMKHDAANSVDGDVAIESSSEALMPLPGAESEMELSTTGESDQEKAMQDELAQPNAAQKKTKTKATANTKVKSKPSASTSKVQESTVDDGKPTEPTNSPNKNDDKSTWDTIKESVTTGSDAECSQAAIALNQCVK